MARYKRTRRNRPSSTKSQTLYRRMSESPPEQFEVLNPLPQTLNRQMTETPEQLVRQADIIITGVPTKDYRLPSEWIQVKRARLASINGEIQWPCGTDFFHVDC